MVASGGCAMGGRVALIIGGAGGMGSAIAAGLAGQGFRVAVADLGERLEGAPGWPVPLDLRDVGSCTAAVAATVEWGGRLDVVVNAAGVWREGPSDEVTEADWDLVMDVNLKGAFFVIRAALAHMGAGGAILNIASDAGLVGNAGAAVYCASKGGLVLLTKALALELAPRGIRVNALCPGDVATPMVEFQAERYGAGDPAGYKAALLAHYPQGPAARFITAAEIAGFACYLCSDQAAPITGAALSMDFGVSAGY